MEIKNWRERTIEVLADSVGPVSELLVDSAHDALDTSSDPSRPWAYARFLRALHDELPDDLDRKALCDKLCRDMVGTLLPW